jgi:hypothetical protein
MIDWKSTAKDGFPKPGQRVIAIQENPILGTEIVTLYGCDFDGTGYHKEPYITHWCATQDVEIPEGIPPIRREP